MKLPIFTACLVAVAFATLGAAPAGSPAPSLPAATGLNFHQNPQALAASCDATIATAKTAYEKILATPADKTTFSTLQAIETAGADFNDATAVPGGLWELSPDEAVRKASADCFQKVSNYNVEVQSDPRIYAVAQHVGSLASVPLPAGTKLVEYYVIGGKRAGAGLDPAVRKR
ncbi:MAG TPA: hypothetical protein VN860_02705, partial [Candidatus Acidoferrales bacterium]|nr:hypothetical protein [Candidatus Acidoferrales bacterium]